VRLPVSAAVMAVLALLASPGALACEDPDNVTITLRDTPPDFFEAGEIVLELDANSWSVIERPPLVVEGQGHELIFDRTFASYKVVRVLAGQYTEPTARVLMTYDSCHDLGGGMSGPSYLVVRDVVEEEDGFIFLRPRPITGKELRLQWEAEQKADN
jgi:hypothetical protein